MYLYIGKKTYMLFSKALLLSSSESAAADHWLEVSSIRTEPLSSGRTLVDWVSCGDGDGRTKRQRDELFSERPGAIMVDRSRNKVKEDERGW